jgi:hypothetical protein
MKRPAILFILLFIVKIGFAQVDIESRMTEKAPNCEDIAFNCTQLIEKYYNASRMDSVEAILNYWEDKCGLSEPVIRIKILLSIRDHEFTESIYDTTIVDYIIRFSDRVGIIHPMETYNYYKIYFSYVQIDGSFDKMTGRIAAELLGAQSEDSLEFLFCKLYSGEPDFFFSEIQSKDKYKGTKLKEYYFDLVDRSINLPESHFAFYSGIWLPFDNANTLGVHPVIGLEGGCRFRKFNFNLSLYLKFVKTANEYTVMVKDSVYVTDYFLGGYVGLNIDREIFKYKKNEFDFLLGIGYDGFSALDYSTSDSNPDNDEDKSINSLNINTGLGYRYNFKSKTYVGLRCNYNFVNYINSGGTDLSGNTMTIVLVAGGFGNQKKSSNLEALHYKY